MNGFNVALRAPRASGIGFLVCLPPLFCMCLSDVVDDGVAAYHLVCDCVSGLTGLSLWAESFTFTESPCKKYLSLY